MKTSGWGYWPLEGKFTLLLWEKWAIVSLWLRSFLNFAAVALQVAHNKATQEGLTLDDSAATQHFAKVMAAQLQAWIPSPQHEVQVQAKIAALQAELASLKANTIPTSPLCRRSIYSTWFQALTLERTILETIEKNIAAVDKWWQAQPEDATTSIHRVAICFGVPLGKITSSQNEHLLKILKVAVTLTSWLSNLLKTSKNMTSIVSALALCKHQIGILASLSPLTLSSSINIFFAYRIWWCSMYNTTHLEMANSWQIYEELPALDTFMELHCWHINSFLEAFLNFFILVRLKTILLAENIPDTENLSRWAVDSLCYRSLLYDLGLIATTSFGGHQFLSIYAGSIIGRLNMHYIIQLWQLKLNLPLYFAVFHATQRNHF